MKSKLLKNTIKLLKDEPINTEERLDVLEKQFNVKITQLEDTVSTFQDVILRINEENTLLKRENDSLKFKLKENLSHFSSNMSESMKSNLVEPAVKAGEEMAELVFNEDNGQRMQIIDATAPDEVELPSLENSPSSAKLRTIKWMREKFGLQPEISTPEKKKFKKKK